MNAKTFKLKCPGYDLVADLYEGSDPDKVVLFLIGYNSSRDRYKPLMEAVTEATGATGLVFDYSGHGDSPFELRDTMPAQHFSEVIYAFDWVEQNYLNAEVTVIGTSYGGFLATQLTKYRSFEKLLLRVPALYPPEEFYTPWSQRLDHEESYSKKLARYRSDNQQQLEHPLLRRASKYKGKTLVLVHENDEMVPLQTTDAYIEAFQAESYLAKGVNHSPRDLNEQQLTDYHKIITDWLTKTSA